MNYYEEEDFVVEPRIIGYKKNILKEDDWYPYEIENNYKPLLRMAPRKKQELEEYNFQRQKVKQKQEAQRCIKNYLEEQDIPRDIIDEILTKAGFYIPRVLVFGAQPPY